MIYFENFVAMGVIAMTKKSMQAIVINSEVIGWKNLIAIGWFFFIKKKLKIYKSFSWIIIFSLTCFAIQKPYLGTILTI